MLIELKNINKTYVTKTGVTFRALSNVSTTFEDKGMVFLVGKSGSGKSTLLNIVGGLDSFDSGELYVCGKPTKNLKSSEIDSFRNTMVGFVFQEYNLIESLNVYDNVKLALDMQKTDSKHLVDKALEEVGILDKAKNKTKNLSGGQRQRIAIARAIVKEPKIILADEPTGALDSVTGTEVMNIFKEMSKSRLIVIVTHDMDKAMEYGDRIIEMKDGKIYRDIRRKDEGEVFDSHNVSFVSDSIVRIDKGVELNDSDYEKINEIVSQAGRKTFINVETDPRKIKALFPNLREAVEQHDSTTGEDDENGELKESFVPYSPRNVETPTMELKKSHLPTARAFRMGLTNLNHKKGRLILTILMAVIALTLFGIAQSFTNFDTKLAIGDTMIKEQAPYMAVTTAGSGGTGRIKETDFKDMKDKNPNLKFSQMIAYPFRIDNIKLDSELTSFTGVIEIEDASDINFSILYGSSKPKSANSIIISQFMAEMILRSDKVVPQAVKNMAQLVGQNLSLNGRIYIIDGIFQSKTIKDYQELSPDEKAAKIKAQAQIDIAQLLVRPGFMLLQNKEVLNSGFELVINAGDSNGYDKGKQPISVSFASDKMLDDENWSISTEGVSDGSFVLDTQDDIFISTYVLQQLYLYDVNEINADENRSLVLYYNKKPVFVSSKFKIRGFLSSQEATSSSDRYVDELLLSLKSSVLPSIYSSSVVVNQIMVSLNGNDNDTRQCMDYVFGNGFAVNSEYVESYDFMSLLLVVLNQVFIGLALILSLLVVVLLFNFISTSIRLTKKQIGILRALGARKIDTFKIYAMEGIIVTSFSLLISCALILIGGPIVNVSLSAVFGHYFALITVNVWVFMLMIALTLVITVISILIPLRKFNKITPIDAISEKV